MAAKKPTTGKTQVKNKATTSRSKTTKKAAAKAKPGAAAKSKTATTKTTTKTTTKSASVAASKSKTVKASNRIASRDVLIQQQAYYIAEKRGFIGGDPVMDWLQAEKQVDEMLK